MKVYYNKHNKTQTGHYLNIPGNTKETLDIKYFSSSEFKEMKLRVNTFFKEMINDVLNDKEKEKYLKQFDDITSEIKLYDKSNV